MRGELRAEAEGKGNRGDGVGRVNSEGRRRTHLGLGLRVFALGGLNSCTGGTEYCGLTSFIDFADFTYFSDFSDFEALTNSPDFRWD